MKKFFILLIIFCLTGCTDKKNMKQAGITGEFPVIDVVGNIGKYQRVYCSDYFSSIELIPLETNDHSIIGTRMLENIVFINDSLIFVLSELYTGNILYSSFPRELLVFDRAGNFRNKIGNRGQGPGEYIGIAYYYLNQEKSTIFIDDQHSILEYDFSGKFISSFPKPSIESKILFYQTDFIDDNIFFGYSGFVFSRENPYFLFDRKGEIIKIFHSHFFSETYYTTSYSAYRFDAFHSFRINQKLFFKDAGINDTIYTIDNLDFKPVYVFDFGKYAHPLEKMNTEGKIKIKNVDSGGLYFLIWHIVGTPKYYFYKLCFPTSLPKPKSRPEMGGNGQLITRERDVYGIYDIENSANLLLDTDHLHQKGIINDINGGFSIIPRFYAGNDEVVDIWRAEEMKEMLTDEYFATQNIKDKQAHQKLRELLKNLKEDDNPVIVIAKMK